MSNRILQAYLALSSSFFVPEKRKQLLEKTQSSHRHRLRLWCWHLNRNKNLMGKSTQRLITRLVTWSPNIPKLVRRTSKKKLNLHHTLSLKMYLNVELSNAWKSLFLAWLTNQSNVSSEHSSSSTKQDHSKSTWCEVNSEKYRTNFPSGKGFNHENSAQKW